MNDATKPSLILQGCYPLKDLVNLVHSHGNIPLIDQNYEIQGKLEINITPVNSNDSENLLFFPDKINDLIGKSFDFVVQIKNVSELSHNFCGEVYAEYSFYLDSQKCQTEITRCSNKKLEFNYEKKHSIKTVTK